MSRPSPFDHPLFLGFEPMERLLQELTHGGGNGYPPFNIEQHGEQTLRITLAVAGFTTADLDITQQDDRLTIAGHRPAEEERTFLHKGIGTRSFRRTFVLATGIEVAGARLEHGLLRIDLARPPKDERVRKIEISG